MDRFWTGRIAIKQARFVRRQNMRFHLAFLALAILPGAVFNSALADPDLSMVRAIVSDGTCQVVASGRTRVDLVMAVRDGLEACDVSADGITVGPWLRLPPVEKKQRKQVITVCMGSSMDGGEKTGYIGVTPNTPFKLVAAITEQLKGCGLTDIRLLSDETIGTIMQVPRQVHDAAPSSALKPDAVVETELK